MEIRINNSTVQIPQKPAAMPNPVLVLLASLWDCFSLAVAMQATIKAIRTKTYDKLSTRPKKHSQRNTKEINQAIVMPFLGFVTQQHILFLRHSVKSEKVREQCIEGGSIGKLTDTHIREKL